MANYLNVARIKKLAKEHNRRVGKDFILYLDAFIETKIIQASELHNGGKKTLDSAIAGYIGLNGKRGKK